MTNEIRMTAPGFSFVSWASAFFRHSSFRIRHFPGLSDGRSDTHLQDPVPAHARMDSPLLREDMAISEALDFIREKGVGERIVDFSLLLR